MIPLLAGPLGRDPDAVAIADESGTRSWRELADEVGRWAGELADAGVGAGDTVGIVAGNRREVFAAMLACLHSGVTVVPVNQLLTAAEIADIVSDSGARGMIVDAARRRVVTEALELAAATATLFDIAHPPASDAAVPAGRCGQLMVYTSGTTGMPKGVVNGLFVTGDPWARVRRVLDYAGRALDVPAQGRVLLVGPWYHAAQLFFALMPLLRGATLIIRERFEAGATLAVLHHERITHCHLVPTQFVRLLRLGEAARRGFDPGALQRIWHGGAACPAHVKRRMIEWWGPVLAEYYGASESGAVTLISSAEWLRRPGSVGRALAPNEILILDRNGARVPAGERGLICIKRSGRGFAYHNAAEQTRAAYLEPGVFTVGDVGYLDGDGYLFVTGRAKDVIITGGVNVYPAEVEAVLLRHSAVRDVAVVGVPDEEFGERVAAVVELAAGAADQPWSELDRHCRGVLAGFKVPRQYLAVDRLPRELTGKVRANRLRELIGS